MEVNKLNLTEMMELTYCQFWLILLGLKIWVLNLKIIGEDLTLGGVYLSVIQFILPPAGSSWKAGSGIRRVGGGIYKVAVRPVLVLVRAACVCCPGTKCPLLTAFFSLSLLSPTLNFSKKGYRRVPKFCKKK